MRVVIFGCGRTGASLALMLTARGHSVTIIEQNRRALRRLGKDHNCEIVFGSGLEDDILEKAQVRDAECFFALTRGDNTNLMSAQIVRLKFNCPKVCIKVADPLRAEAYRKLGFFCITPSALTSGMMRDWLISEPYGTIDNYNLLPEELRI
ncbi:MAG: TrkA family potassium uptake protein [Fimbriimonadaceae bacterium]|uniref:K+ transport system, NAD-binding component n=1 Tax=Candidatus Nitrosymbiomonas proteolyticus TaxID=2608984 RepID=A0A809R9W0_9BACT|nr:TrkA family potassium uptake protein [Fimbriimonadaceae bacterium]NUM39759.1 TrkA family potassium uptake protein [Armatimonadota bacterium]BBO24280.1 K+ transport system, NAD-binding component [Candidatus Nitrosymbiomonas proteolyticus]